MAFSEIFEMNDLPIKVSINEYIEILNTIYKEK